MTHGSGRGLLGRGEYQGSGTGLDPRFKFLQPFLPSCLRSASRTNINKIVLVDESTSYLQLLASFSPPLSPTPGPSSKPKMVCKGLHDVWRRR